MNNLERVREFMEAMGQGLNLPFSSKAINLRIGLIEEEYTEVCEEVYDNLANLTPKDNDKIDRKALTKELADMLYVIYGFGLTFGLPLQEVFEEVHKSNMSKLDEYGQPIFREDGKVLKGPNYKSPDLERFFENQIREVL